MKRKGLIFGVSIGCAALIFLIEIAIIERSMRFISLCSFYICRNNLFLKTTTHNSNFFVI